MTLCLAVLAAANPVPELIVVERDTIGGTTYDWQQSGPAIQTMANDPVCGVHVTWMVRAATGPYPDRNKRYNFYDNQAGAWNSIDPTNYMNSGVNSFVRDHRARVGGRGPGKRCAVIKRPLHDIPSVLKDAAPGAGIFSECAGPPNCSLYVWPVTGITSDGKIHNALIDGHALVGTTSRIDP